jgi:hypothetical protein
MGLMDSSDDAVERCVVEMFELGFEAGFKAAQSLSLAGRERANLEPLLEHLKAQVRGTFQALRCSHPPR